jgi:hypothetical protein
MCRKCPIGFSILFGYLFGTDNGAGMLLNPFEQL